MTGPPLAVVGALVHSPHVLWRRSSRGVLLLTSALATPRSLEGTAAALWDCFARPCTPEAAAARLATAFEIHVAHVQADIAPVVADLVTWGALVSPGVS